MSNDDFMKELAAMSADEDQVKAHTKALAERLGMFRKTLLTEGFSVEQTEEFCHMLIVAILQINVNDTLIQQLGEGGNDEDE